MSRIECKLKVGTQIVASCELAIFVSKSSRSNLYEEEQKPSMDPVFVQLSTLSTLSYYNFNPCGIFEKMMSFTPIFNQELEQGKLMAVLNSRK